MVKGDMGRALSLNMIVAIWTVTSPWGCAPESVPPTPSRPELSPPPVPTSGTPSPDHTTLDPERTERARKVQELQAALDFAKSEVQRFDASLKERQRLSDEKIAKAQLQVDEQQKKIDAVTTRAAGRALSPQESLEVEQAKRDKAQADKQVELEKNTKTLNENPIEDLIDAKRKEIEKLQAELTKLRSESGEPGEE